MAVKMRLSHKLKKLTKNHNYLIM